jgi:lipopolysaccharide/colanic/teichoic acid biosynthesis glycosyltransferase
VTPPERSPGSPFTGKRILDLALLAVGALPAVLVGLACGLLVRASSPGPVLFRQERVGRDGRPFIAFKFRSMRDGPNPLYPDASRITPVGRVLRRTSLDELPQLINVLRGEMSIVGPRPALRYQVGRYDAVQRGRLAVRPGITGLAQINGRNEIAWGERIAWDLQYVEQQSVGLDLTIIARTFVVVALGRGVHGHSADDPIAAVPEAEPKGDPTDTAHTELAGRAPTSSAIDRQT